MRMTAMLGYARVSTIGQDLEAQLAALDAAGVDPIRVLTDKLSGSAKTARPGLVPLLDYAWPGDTVVVAAIDRLGGFAAEVTRTIADLGERRITLHVLREGVDTATPTRATIAAIMASLAELELELGRELRAASRESRRARQSAGHQTPQAQPSTARTVAPLAVAGEPVHQLAEAFGIGRATAYRSSLPQPESARMVPGERKVNEVVNMPSLCRVKLPVSTDWFDPSISHQYSCSSEAISRLAQQILCPICAQWDTATVCWRWPRLSQRCDNSTPSAWALSRSALIARTWRGSRRPAWPAPRPT